VRRLLVLFLLPASSGVADLELSPRRDRYLSSDVYRHDTHSWAQERGLKIFHLPIEVSKDPTVEVDQVLVKEALEKILGAFVVLRLVNLSCSVRIKC